MRPASFFPLLLAAASACAAPPDPPHADGALQLTRGKSSIVALPSDATRLSVGDPEVADVMMIQPRELYVLAKRTGTTNVMVWTKDGHTTVLDLSVGPDIAHIRAQIQGLMPGEEQLSVDVLGDTVLLGGTVRDPVSLQRLLGVADALGDGKKTINLVRLQASAVQQTAVSTAAAPASALLSSAVPLPPAAKPEVIRGVKRTLE